MPDVMSTPDDTSGNQPASPAQPAAAPSASPAAAQPMPNPAATATPAVTPAAGAAPVVKAAAPAIVHPVRRTGLAGIVDEIRDALSGGNETTKVYQDANGDKYVKKETLTHGQQWMRIAGEALHGAGAGLAAGKGKGLLAGIEAGQKDAAAIKNRPKQQDAEVQKQQLDKYNMIKVKHDVAASEFELTRKKALATEGDVKFAQQQQDREKELGSADLGVYADAHALADVQEHDPKFWKNVYANDIVTVPELAPDGTRKGIHVYLRTQGIGNSPVPQGTVVYDFVAPKKPGEQPQLVPRTLTQQATHNQVDAWNGAATKKMQDWTKEQVDQADKKAQEKQRLSEITKNNAEANKYNAEAAKDRAATSEAGSEALIDEIGTGKIALGRLSYLAAKNPQLLANVAKKYPDFDSSRIQSYADAYHDFTSGPTSKALNAGGTALGHLSELKALNTPMSHIPHTPAWTAYQNKAATVATELAKFYGDTTIPAIENIKSTLTSTLPGNRQAAIATQAQSMGDKLDAFEQTWQNAAPSKAYQALMPTISKKAMEARAALDPEYAKRRVQELTAQKGGATTPAPSGMAVSLTQAMSLPNNKGKTKEQVRADIIAHGHQVTE